MSNPSALRAAQHGHVADAATRRQDRSDFETWIRPECLPESIGAAQLSGSTLGGHHQRTPINRTIVRCNPGVILCYSISKPQILAGCLELS
jgi:hypothetical protein